MLFNYCKLPCLFLCIFLLQNTHAQKSDSTAKNRIQWFSFAPPHSPTKASVYAALLPGLGQIYNKKYWKLPIVYGALAWTTYTIITNQEKKKNLEINFRRRYSDNITTNDPTTFEIETRDNYRRNRDIGILVTGVIYALQIVDATVDAHFYEFDLQRKKEKKASVSINYNPSKLIGFNYQLNGQKSATRKVFAGITR